MNPTLAKAISGYRQIFWYDGPVFNVDSECFSEGCDINFAWSTGVESSRSWQIGYVSYNKATNR